MLGFAFRGERALPLLYLLAALAGALLALTRATVDLLKHRRHYAQQRDDEATQCKKKSGGLPQRAIAGQALLKAIAHKRHAAGKEREQQQCRGKNVQIASHFSLC
jgi:hypothetical protein